MHCLQPLSPLTAAYRHTRAFSKHIQTGDQKITTPAKPFHQTCSRRATQQQPQQP